MSGTGTGNFCGHCGHRFVTGEHFCPSCGQPRGGTPDRAAGTGATGDERRGKPLLLGLAAVLVVGIGIGAAALALSSRDNGDASLAERADDGPDSAPAAPDAEDPETGTVTEDVRSHPGPDGPTVVRGAVIDASRNVPVEGAAVAVERLDGSPAASAVTSADGQWEADLQAGGAYVLRVAAPGVGGPESADDGARTFFVWEGQERHLRTRLPHSVAADADRITAPPAGFEPGTSGERLQGQLRDADGTPVEDVALVVATLDGSRGVLVRTDADGEWSADLPGPGDYAVALDVTTLPATVAPRDPGRMALEVNVRAGQQRSILFALGQRAEP